MILQVIIQELLNRRFFQRSFFPRGSFRVDLSNVPVPRGFLTEMAKESTGAIVNSTGQVLTQMPEMAGNKTTSLLTTGSAVKCGSRIGKVIVRYTQSGGLDFVSSVNIASVACSSASSALRLGSIVMEKGYPTSLRGGTSELLHIASVGLSALADSVEDVNGKTVSQKVWDILFL
jgi:hypothetical protein